MFHNLSKCSSGPRIPRFHSFFSIYLIIFSCRLPFNSVNNVEKLLHSFNEAKSLLCLNVMRLPLPGIQPKAFVLWVSITLYTIWWDRFPRYICFRGKNNILRVRAVSERVRYCSCQENIKSISLSYRVMFYLRSKNTNEKYVNAVLAFCDFKTSSQGGAAELIISLIDN